MKLLFAVLLIALASSGVLTLPARNSPQDDAEVISVPQRRPVSAATDTDFDDFKGVIDTGAGYPFLQPNPSAFNLGFFDSFDDIFRRLRTRLWPVTVGSDESEAGSGDSASETGFPLGFGLRALTPLDTKNGNTTSTVKVVDGHRLEINETVYGDSNNVFKVRLVNVRPLESGEEVIEGVINNNGEIKPESSPSTSAPPKRSELDDSDEEDRREPLEKQPRDNEVRDIDGPQRLSCSIARSRDRAVEGTTTTTSTILAEDSIAESTDNRHTIMADMMKDVQREEEEKEQEQEQMVAAQDADTMAHNEETEMPLHDSDSHIAAPESEAIEIFGDETDSELVDPPQSEFEQMQLHREREELESSDDEENFAAPIEMSDTFNDEWATLDGENADPDNDLNNHIDIYEKFVPVDLSNDIAVNDAAAANPDYPSNPDAELIAVVPVNVQTMPKFEKLSLMPPRR
ncbi:hypothetical protein ACLKA7_004082 [Drosophila subpalustris]